MRWAVLILVLGGCDRVFGLHDLHADAATTDVAIDGSGVCPPGGTLEITVSEDTFLFDGTVYGAIGFLELRPQTVIALRFPLPAPIAFTAADVVLHREQSAFGCGGSPTCQGPRTAL